MLGKSSSSQEVIRETISAMAWNLLRKQILRSHTRLYFNMIPGDSYAH